ncbi:hypothetical protein H2201_000589 [Coniosporium apollinis]|uniref:Thioredoxin domain-containing protein n=1 Tax=Coniosporium apollinis TaxID=61459 RepID=A0ABQ9P4C6_9PEZI|nr:hypothetical protein H2201_000589 [Coniosporium apollinis]
MSRSYPEEKRTGSPLWNKALERYREELEENDDYQDIIEVRSLEDLLYHAKSIESLLPQERTALNSMSRLGPKLKFVDDFSAAIALYFGADATLTALVWGSIRLMLTLASSAGDTLQDVLDMLEELSLTLPRFKTYEKTLPMGKALETALLDVYTEVICFYARAIHFFRAHPHVLLRRGAWEDFRKDFGQTVRRIKRMSSAVESEADLARMKIDEFKYKEVLDLMNGLKKSKVHDEEVIQCYHIPSTINPGFWGRDQALQAISEALDPEEDCSSVKAFALYGMGGAGKTQLALQYANRSRGKYNAILWIAADNTISMGQSFRDVARKLGLVNGDEEVQDSIAAILKVKEWLTDARFPWLLIFDNADELEILRLAWPGNAHGSVLLTTRDFNAARSPAPTGLHVQPFDDATGSDVLLRLVGLDAKLPSNQEKARAITHALGGLPLALSQIGGFISQRKLPLQDFLPLYERNAAKIDSRKTGLSDYEHTLSTVWEMSFSKISGNSRKLLDLLVFFEPDAISELVLTEGSKLVHDEGFNFLQDDMDLGDAEEDLLQAALIEKNIDDATLSVHRLVQAAVIRRLTDQHKSKYFDVVVRIISWGFPDTWSEDIGHQFGAWTKCEKCLPHVDHLVKQAESWYLYERECYDVARKLVDVALQTFDDKSTLAFASATDLSGLIDFDMNNPAKALVPFNAALAIREARLGPDDPLIASSLNNIALAYTEMAELDKAYATHQKAIDIRLRTHSDRIGNSYSNMSSLLLRMGKPDEAEDMLKMCPSLKDFTDETFLETGNPRFSGDMVLLSRIRLRQGRLDDAMRLASKALTFRQKMLGNRLKTCDSLYDVADLLHRQGNIASAIELLTQLVATSETLNEGEGQLARANYKLAVLYSEKGMAAESEHCKARAMELRAKLQSESKDALFEESEFAKLYTTDRIHTLDSKVAYLKALNEDGLMIVEGVAEWCGQCKAIAPTVSKLSEKYPKARFYQFDVDKEPDIAQELGIRSMPTFTFFVDGDVQEGVTGAKPKEIEEAVRKYYPGDTE